MRRPIMTLLALAAATPLAAQQSSTGAVVDRVVAVVGTRAILLSQLEEQVVQLRAQGDMALPEDSAGWEALRLDLLNEMVRDQLLVQQAERDTLIRISEQEVLDQVEQTYQNVRRQFATEAEFQTRLREAGFGAPDEWRRYLGEQQRRTILRQRLMESLRQQGLLRPISPTDSMMRAYFDARRAQLPPRPPVVSFRQIVVEVVPDSATKAEAARLADSLATAIRKGADFATLARRFSSDSASRENGGELGWFRRGVMVKAFEAVAFSLRPGEVSPPVETKYGFHVIKVERSQPAEVLARHILLTPPISDAQLALIRARADSIRAALAAGASFDLLARRYSDPEEPKAVERAPLSQLSPAYQERLTPDTVRGLQPVFELREGAARPRFVVLDVFERQAGGPVEFEDVKERLRELLGQELALDHYLDRLRQETYVDIRL